MRARTAIWTCSWTLGPERSAFFPAGLIADLEEYLGRRVDVLTEGALHWYIRDQVLREAVAL